MNISKLSSEQRDARRRIVEISYRSGFSHLGSCLTAVDIIDAIYKVKTKNDRFVLSSGHAAIAFYVILEKYGFITPSAMKTLHIHPDRNVGIGIDVSTGSLGQGLPIALGMALADNRRKVFCLVTDGECAEGSVWESLRIIYEKSVKNIIVFINANGWGAYDAISIPLLLNRVKGFGFAPIVVDGHDRDGLEAAIKKAKSKGPSIIFANTDVEQFPFLKGQDAHYHVMDGRDYKLALEKLK